MSTSRDRSRPKYSGLVLVFAAGVLLPASAFAERWFSGEVVASAAERFRSPIPVSDLAGWRGLSRTAELLKVVGNGEQVSAGDVLASFAFPEGDLRRGIEREIRSARAERERTLAGLSDRLRELKAKAEQARLEVRRSKLELKKRAVLSRRDFKLVKLAGRRAAFEVKAVDQQIRAQQEVIQAVRAFQDERVRQAERMNEDLQEIGRRFTIRAPHPGLVVLPRMANWNRPVRPGDRLSPGVPFLNLSANDRLAVEFFVSEDALGNLREGFAVSIQAFSGGERVSGKVIRIHPFPARSGRRGSGDSKARVLVTAELPAGTTGFSPGQPVRVGL